MRRSVLALFALMFAFSTQASADWRWASPKLKPHKHTYSCADMKCLKKVYNHERRMLRHRINLYNKHRREEWQHWITTPIADCTWAGESSPPGDTSGQFARYRYTVPNSAGSDAYGKYQMMPGTYSSYAKYGDWSPLDQEIAGHRLYADKGTGPWQSCG